MAKNFLILGLPRSRTFWLSKLFTDPRGILCYHELVGIAPTTADQLAALHQPFTEWVGDSDSGLLLHLEALYPNLSPDTRFAFIYRDPSDAAEELGAITRSPHRIKFFRDFFPAMNAHLRRWQTVLGEKAFGTSFNSLNDEATVRALWSHLLPGVSFPDDRYAALKDQVLTVPDEDIRKAGEEADRRVQAHHHR